MKKTTSHLLAVLFLVTIFLTSCKSEKEYTFENPSESRDMIIQAKLEKTIKAKLQYPDSYEFVGLQLKDSISYMDNVIYYKNFHQKILDADRKNFEKQLTLQKQKSDQFNKQKFDEYQLAITKNEKILSEIDKLTANLGSKLNTTASYTYNYFFKSKNVSGKDASYTYIVQTDNTPEFKILKVAEKDDMILLNDLPGYFSMVESFE